MLTQLANIISLPLIAFIAVFGVVIWRLNVWDRARKRRMTPEQIAQEEREIRIPGDWGG